MEQLSEPPVPSTEFATEASIIEAFATTQTQNSHTIARILGCMTEGFLRTLPRKKGSRKLPRNPSAKEWRHKFYRSVAGFLGWCEQRPFPEEILRVVRERLWPDIRVFRNGEGCGETHDEITSSDRERVQICEGGRCSSLTEVVDILEPSQFRLTAFGVESGITKALRGQEVEGEDVEGDKDEGARKRPRQS